MERKNSDIILSKDWYKFYVKCFEDLAKIRKILEGKTFKEYYSKNYPDGITDEFWDELCGIYNYSAIQSSYEYEKLTKEK
jgi:hypothetical protein